MTFLALSDIRQMIAGRSVVVTYAIAASLVDGAASRTLRDLETKRLA